MNELSTASFLSAPSVILMLCGNAKCGAVKCEF